MAAPPRGSYPLLLQLTDEDFQRGYIGSRPPPLLLGEHVPSLPSKLPPAPSHRRRWVVSAVVGLAALAISVELLKPSPAPTMTVLGTETHQVVAKEEPAQPRVVATAEPKIEPKAVVAPVAAPVVAPAIITPVPKAAPIAPIAPVAPIAKVAIAPKPIAATPPPVAAAPTANEPKAEAAPAPKAEPPPPSDMGVDQAGF